MHQARLASHQPGFLPWCGFWNKALWAKTMILSVGTEFDYAKYINRVPLGDGWLTMPVQRPKSKTPIKDVRVVDDTKSFVVLSKTIEQEFGSKASKYPDRVGDVVSFLQSMKGGEFLWEVNYKLLEIVNNVYFGGSIAFILDMEIPRFDHSTSRRLSERVLRNTKENQIAYLAGHGALDYLNLYEISDHIDVFVQVTSMGIPDDTILAIGAIVDDTASVVEAFGGPVPLGKGGTVNGRA